VPAFTRWEGRATGLLGYCSVVEALAGAWPRMAKAIVRVPDWAQCRSAHRIAQTTGCSPFLDTLGSARRQPENQPQASDVTAQTPETMTVTTLFGSLAYCGGLTRIMVMPETMSLAAVKARFSELVDRVERQQDRVVVTRNGKPAAVLISAEDLESLEETLAVMSDRSVAAQIRDSQKAVAAGEPSVSLSELRAGLEQRRRRVK
jgi:antitoxin YefM